jgi:hypothetical protein
MSLLLFPRAPSTSSLIDSSAGLACNDEATRWLHRFCDLGFEDAKALTLLAISSTNLVVHCYRLLCLTNSCLACSPCYHWGRRAGEVSKDCCWN